MRIKISQSEGNQVAIITPCLTQSTLLLFDVNKTLGLADLAIPSGRWNCKPNEALKTTAEDILHRNL